MVELRSQVNPRPNLMTGENKHNHDGHSVRRSRFLPDLSASSRRQRAPCKVVRRASQGAWINAQIFSLFFLLLSPASLGDDEEYLKAYKEGLAAIKSRQWESAELKMREALEGRPDEKGKLLKKGYLRPYLPHYYLGVALFELDDCEGALVSWAESERQGVISGRKAHRDMRRSQNQCKGTSEISEQESASITRTANEQSTTAQTVESASPRNRSSKTRPQRTRVHEQHRVKSTSEIGQLIREVEQLLALAGQDQRSSPIVQELELQLSRLREQTNERQDIDLLFDELHRAYETARRILDFPPSELDSAASYLLSGDYRKALDILAGFSPVDERAKFQIHLIRSAAFFNLSRVGDGTNLLIQARSEAQAALTARPESILLEPFFSPPFRDFFFHNNSDAPEE